MKYVFLLLFSSFSMLSAQFGLSSLEDRLVSAEDSLTFYYQEESCLAGEYNDIDLIIVEYKVDLWQSRIKLLTIQIELRKLIKEQNELTDEYFIERAKIDSIYKKIN